MGKATIYRRYPSKAMLVAAAASKAADEQAPIADTGSVRGDLTTALRNLRRLLDDPVVGAAKRMLLVDAERNEELARMHAESVRDRRQGVFDVFRRGVERGELLPDIDVEFAADRIGAQVFYRNLVTRVRRSPTRTSTRSSTSSSPATASRSQQRWRPPQPRHKRPGRRPVGTNSDTCVGNGAHALAAGGG